MSANTTTKIQIFTALLALAGGFFAACGSGAPDDGGDLPPPSPGTAPGAETALVRLPAADFHASDIEAARVSDYGSFVWLELTADELLRLRQQLPTAALQEGSFELQLSGISFDPALERFEPGRGLDSDPDHARPPGVGKGSQSPEF